MSAPAPAPANAPAPAPAAAAAAAAPAPLTSASLYVGDLNPDVTEPILYSFFNEVGPVSSIRVCRDSITRRSLCYGYVNFNSPDDAERALDLLNYKMIKDRPCRLMWKQRDPSMRRSGAGNVFIKNLDPSINSRHLDDTFADFGVVLSCKIVADEEGKSKGYGFVQFETQDMADKAIQEVNGKSLAGRKVFVARFMPRNQYEQMERHKQFTNVFVKNLAQDMSKERLQELFSKFGEISSCVVMEEEGASKGFGFVNFKDPENAAKAVDEMNGKPLGDDGKELFVGRAQRKHARQQELRRHFEARRAERVQKTQGMNLYVKNLDEDVTDEKLREAFEPFGAVTSAKVRSDERGASRCFGFVCFSTQDEAMRALSEMSGKVVWSKPLFVALLQPREIRRAQLQAQFQQRQQMLQSMQRYPPGGMVPPQQMQLLFAPGQAMPRPNHMFMFPQQMQQGPRGVRVGGPYPRGPGFQGPPRGRGMRQGGGVPPVGVQQPVQPRPAGAAPQKYPAGAAAAGGRPVAMAQPAAAAAPPPVPVSPLSLTKQELVTMLATCPPEQQKNILGERLYALIQPHEPQRAGKITGMLLDGLETAELLNLVDSPAALEAKIQEALAALKSQPTQ